MSRKLEAVRRHLREGEAQAAERLLEPLLAQRHKDPHVCYLAARVNLVSGDYEQAKQYAAKAWQADQSFIAALYLQAYCHRKLQQYEEAVEAYRRIIEKNPTSAVAHLFLADCLRKIGNKDDAIENLLAATRLDSEGDIKELAHGALLSLKESP